MTSAVTGRRLAQSENFFRCRTEVGWYKNFAAVAAYSRDLTHDLSLMYRAIRKTLLDHHVLITNIFKDEAEKTCHARPIAAAKLGDILFFTDDSFSPQGKMVSEEVLNRLCREDIFCLYQDSPLIRLIVMGTHDLAVSFEHTMFDGVCASLFHEVFVENLAFCDDTANLAKYEENYGAVPTAVDMDTPVFVLATDEKYFKSSLPPPVEAIMQDPSVDYTGHDSSHYSKIAPAGFPEKWPGRFPCTLERNVAFKAIHISPSETSAIIKKCRSHGVTFTSYLELIQALVLQPLYGVDHHTSSKVAITLRRFLDPEKLDGPDKQLVAKHGTRIFGNYSNMGLAELIAPVKEFSWEQVKNINAHLAKSVANECLLNANKAWYDTADEFENNRSLFEAALGKSKADSIKISNLGFVKCPVYEVPGKEPWAINDMIFAQDLAPGASEFVLNAVSTERGGLNIVFSYFDHRMDDLAWDSLDTFAQDLKRQLLVHAGL